MNTEITTSGTIKKNGMLVGLALGGLAGNNAHGAGVLQAAMDSGLKPDMISCTSGQIHWVYRYLMALKPESQERNLRELLKADIDKLSPTGIDVIDSAWLGLVGKKGIFRPALLELPPNLLKNLGETLRKIMTSAAADWQTLFSCYRELACILPAQTLVPTFEDTFFQEIAQAFDDPENPENPGIGIAFNSFNVQSGEEYVYLNEQARKLLKVQYDASEGQCDEQLRYRQRTRYQRITHPAVREGLWIYEYGEPRDVYAIDGAYYRQVMLSELAPAHIIYVARPINTRWLGSFPSSWVGLQDLKTEVNFNGSYIGEKDKIALINRLLGSSSIAPEIVKSKDYHPIKLVEIEIQMQRGFFDYAHESLTVFDQAYSNARLTFKQSLQQTSP